MAWHAIALIPDVDLGVILPAGDTVLNALSHGSFGFTVHGSFFTYFLIGQHFLTTNQNLWNKRANANGY